MIPFRFLFRSRWVALAWVSLICVRAVHFAEGQKAAGVDAAYATDSPVAQSHALAAEEAD